MRRPWFLLMALLLLAFNLRPTAVAIGPVLPRLTADLGLGSVSAGILTALPTACFAIFGSMASPLASRLGLHRSVGLSLTLLVLGQGLRIAVPSVFLPATAVSLAGMAICNVLLPSLVRYHFPRRVGLVTAAYSASLSIGLTLASLTTAPVAARLNDWRPALALWTVTAVLALLPWLLMLHHDRRHAQHAHQAAAITMRDVARTRLGWYMVIFFATQSAIAYSVFGWLASMFQGAGATETQAGIYLGLATGLGIPLAFILPAYTARKENPRGVLVIIAASAIAGFTGMLLAPLAAPWLWALLLAIGTASFPIYLSLIGLRARTAAGTAALSGFSQSVAYAFAGLGPFTVSLLHDLTGTWSASIILLMVLVVPLTCFSWLSCRPRVIEDEVHARASQ